MDLVNVTIDDQPVSVPKGTLIVEAAKQVGVDIPVFCYHPKMKPVGACRMCFVEIEKMPRPQTACTTPVGEGMVVRTTTPTVKEAQESVLEFLLINHPLDCPICDKGGECPLQDNTFAYGPGASRYTEVKRRYEKPISISKYIKLDRERCIMCYRCTRFASEIAGDEALTVLDRGSHSEIGLAPGRTFDSPFSGNTIELCPVGALTSDLYRFRARPWDIKDHPTVCTECPVGCNVTLTVRDNSIMRSLARENTPVDDGWLCDHGRFTYRYVSSDERLTQPMIRRDGTLEAVDWDEAIAYAGSKLQEVIHRHGPSSAAGLISERQSNEDMYLFQKLFRAVIGNNNVDSSLERHAQPAAGRLRCGLDLDSGPGKGRRDSRLEREPDRGPANHRPAIEEGSCAWQQAYSDQPGQDRPRSPRRALAATKGRLGIRLDCRRVITDFGGRKRER